MKIKTFVFIFLLMTLELSAQNLIEQSSEFPQYWSYKGELVLLLGGSVEDNLFQIPDLENSLDSLMKVGGNYVRNTMSSRDDGNLWAFYFDAKKELFDLGKWNDEYWARFEKFLQLTSDRDIVVQIELWATFDFYRENWSKNPFNPKNNNNYTQQRVKLPEQIDTHPTWTENPFFWSVPMQQNNVLVLNYQQRFVDKLLSYSLKYGNVLYCIDNETSVPASWGKFWAEYIHKKAQEHGTHVNITEMWDPWDLDHILHRETFDHPEIYDFVEISQNNHQRGQNHWENGLKQIERLRSVGKLRPLTNVKTYGNDLGQHGGGTQNGIQSFIRSVFFGSAAVRFHRPDSGLGLNNEARAVISSMRQLSDSTDFFSAVPSNELLSGRDENEAYCRAIPGKYYAVYFTNGGEVNLNLKDTKGKVKIQWLDVMQSSWQSGVSIDGGGSTIIKTPSEGHWVMLLTFKH